MRSNEVSDNTDDYDDYDDVDALDEDMSLVDIEALGRGRPDRHDAV